MYTESFAGDIDTILAREAAKFGIPALITLPAGRGRIDSYGFNKEQREALDAALLTIGRAMMYHYPEGDGKPAIIQIDAQRKIVIRAWYQAANLYQTLTRNDWFAGLEGETGKPHIKRFTI